MEDGQYFSFGGNDALITVAIKEVFGFPDSTSWMGGYDCRGSVEISCKGYQATGELWFSTGQLHRFHSSLRDCFLALSGEASFSSAEGELEVTLAFFPKTGRVSIKGDYRASFEFDTHLEFEIRSDQSYIPATLERLTRIVERYGGDGGIRIK